MLIREAFASRASASATGMAGRCPTIDVSPLGTCHSCGPFIDGELAQGPAEGSQAWFLGKSGARLAGPKVRDAGLQFLGIFAHGAKFVEKKLAPVVGTAEKLTTALHRFLQRNFAMMSGKKSNPPSVCVLPLHHIG